SLSTNNYTGYTLTLAGSSTTTTLNTTGGDTLSSITANTTATDFSADNATGKANNNKWGIMPSSYKSNNSITSNNTTTYLPSPSSSNTITMDETSTANASSAKVYTIGLGVRADYTKTAGTYNNTNSGNTIIIAYVANPTNYAITYNKGNTEDTVNSLPSTQGGNVSATSIALSNTIPTRTGYDFKGWCTVMPTTSNNNDSCTGGTVYNADGVNTTAALTFPINRTTDSNTATLYAMWNIKTFTITRRYRLETATGGWGDYTTEDPVTVAYGGSYTYSKSVTDYKNSASGTNNAGASTSASNVTADQTLSLDFYRNTYTLTVTASTNTSSATGGGTYRWGQTATVGVTKATDVTCTTYATPTWTQSGTTGTFSSTSGASVNFTMGKGNATVTATSSASNVAQTITLSRSTGASGITIAGTNYTGTSASLNCGTYNISGNYSSNYEFSSWSTANNVTVASTSTASTTMTVNGAGTLTLNAKSSIISLGYMQDLTLNSCKAATTDKYTATDKRDNKVYSVRYINNYCWMTQNLRFTGASVDTTNSNVTSNKTLTWYSLKDNASSSSTECYGAGSSVNGYSNACLQDSGDATTGVWYNYYGATAGTVSGTSNNTAASEDICPKNWHLPTGPNTTSGTEINNLVGNTTSGKQAATTGLTAFSAVTGGYYYNGSLSITVRGYWWYATASSTANRFNLEYNSSNGLFYGNDWHSRYFGFFVRCVRTS
ncbi:hypothetical protein IJJ37_03695, partial [Candidatus Saccharibacteria bacterium]|nr:hypothetical protein [Candidatus Saccharibacteria bacterium]